MNEDNFKKNIKKIFEDIEAPRSHFLEIFNKSFGTKKQSSVFSYGIFTKSLAFVIPLALVFMITFKTGNNKIDPITNSEISDLISYESNINFDDIDFDSGDYDFDFL